MSSQGLFDIDPGRPGAKAVDHSNKMQTERMCALRTSSSGSRGSKGGDWKFNSAPFLFHNAHVAEGYGKSKGCGVCAKGMAALLTKDDIPGGVVVGDEVDESGRADQSGSAAPASDSERRPWWESGEVQG